MGTKTDDNLDIYASKLRKIPAIVLKKWGEIQKKSCKMGTKTVEKLSICVGWVGGVGGVGAMVVRKAFFFCVFFFAFFW